MSNRCHEADRVLESGEPVDATAEKRWHRHLEECSSCRDQIAADTVLRRTFADTPTLAEGGVEGLLGRELATRAVQGSLKVRGRSPRSGPGRSVRWLVATYGTAAAGASLWVLSNLTWGAIPTMVPMAALGLAAALTPVILFDRVGFLRPPG